MHRGGFRTKFLHTSDRELLRVRRAPEERLTMSSNGNDSTEQFPHLGDRWGSAEPYGNSYPPQRPHEPQGRPRQQGGPRQMPNGPQQQWSPQGNQNWQPGPPSGPYQGGPLHQGGPQRPYSQGRPSPHPHGRPPKKKNTSTIVLSVLVILLSLLLLAAAAYFFFGNGSKNDAQQNSASSSAAGTNATAGSNSGNGASESSSEPSESKRAEGFKVPGTWNKCSGSGAPGDLNLTYAEDYGGNQTTCPFATNVRDAFVEHYRKTDQLSGTIEATSPTTGKNYTMSCKDNGTYVTCTGGSNARVYIL